MAMYVEYLPGTSFPPGVDGVGQRERVPVQDEVQHALVVRQLLHAVKVLDVVDA